QIQVSGSGSSVNTASSAEYLVSEIKRRKTVTAMVAIVGAAILAAAAYGLYTMIRPTGAVRSANDPAPPALKMRSLTASGNIREAAISPDGKFLAYTENMNGEAGVWTKQIATNSNVQ